jgi:hypothetical protein
VIDTPETSQPLRPTRRWLRLAIGLAGVLLGIAALLAFLASGLLGLFILALTPNPGHEAEVLILKAVLVAGWLAIALWLLHDLRRSRLRSLAAPIAAWIWVWVVGTWLGAVAFLNWGY